MASSASSIRPTTIALATVGATVAGFVAYAIYFDHRRRTDVEFRKQLKRASKAQAKASKAEQEKAGAERRKEVKAIVEKVNEEGWPRDPEEVEKYFMDEVAEGELLCQDGSKNLDAAACFFRALKVYPQPSDLISIYDRTVPKPVLDILAEMVAIDPSISIGGGPSRPTGANPFASMMGGGSTALPEEPLDE